MAQNNSKSSPTSNVTLIMIVIIVGMVGVWGLSSLGTGAGEAGGWNAFKWAIAGSGLLAGGALVAELKGNRDYRARLSEKKKGLLDIVNKYNAVTTLLKQSYDQEPRRGKEDTRRSYSEKYQQNKAAYEQERRVYIAAHSDDGNPTLKRLWKWVLAGGLFGQLMACSYSLGSTDSVNGLLAGQQEPTVWTARTIPMPHLTDGSLYVSNPDTLLSAATVSQMNQTLRRLDDELGIESVVVAVRQIENQDIFRFCQDIFDIYHVGKDDRGLVMVLAYDDHLFRTHTGRSLEADLTDAECFRLQERYLIPSMKAEQPDSGMLYMVDAIYNYMKGKELPTMSTLKKAEQPDEGLGLIGAYGLLLGGWLLLGGFIARRHGWNSDQYASHLFLPNPFARVSAFVGSGPIIFGGGGSRGGGGFGGGGFGGGGFGGGGSFGGGATSSW